MAFHALLQETLTTEEVFHILDMNLVAIKLLGRYQPLSLQPIQTIRLSPPT